MPLYDYKAPSGAIVTMRVPVAERDNQAGYERITVPQRVVVITSPAEPGVAMSKSNVMSGYHRLEQEQGSKFRSSFTPDQIKKAWAT